MKSIGHFMFLMSLLKLNTKVYNNQFFPNYKFENTECCSQTSSKCISCNKNHRHCDSHWLVMAVLMTLLRSAIHNLTITFVLQCYTYLYGYLMCCSKLLTPDKYWIIVGRL